MIKLACYLIVFPLIVWSLDSININGIFKKNRPVQARIIYVAIIFSLSYLVVNFIVDFIVVTKF